MKKIAHVCLFYVLIHTHINKKLRVYFYIKFNLFVNIFNKFDLNFRIRYKKRKNMLL